MSNDGDPDWDLDLTPMRRPAALSTPPRLAAEPADPDATTQVVVALDALRHAVENVEARLAKLERRLTAQAKPAAAAPAPVTRATAARPAARSARATAVTPARKATATKTAAKKPTPRKAPANKAVATKPVPRSGRSR